ncbi:MAG: hypothetical protein E7011_03890 [Alphaproteobacteria bacterium]|nr:hypothetical protein [Alphaproteobacteria bacterium]
MRKIFGLLCVVCIFNIMIHAGAIAGCKLLACDSFSWYEPNGFLHADPSGNQCWGCGLGPNSCGIHDVVPQVDALGDVIGLYQCTFGYFTNSFENYEPGVFCDNSQLKAASIADIDLTNAKKTYRLKGRATSSTSLGDWDVFQGSAACIYVECKAGFVPNGGKTACVADTRESVCVNSGGTYAGGVCSCDAGKKLKQNADKTACECVSADYEYISVRKECEETEASKQRKRKEQQKSSQQRCVASGGVWHGDKGGCKCDANNKNLVVKGLVCECKNGFERDNVTNECKITDLTARKNECKAASDSDAYWADGECKCRDIRKEFVGGKCTEKADIQKCKNIAGAEWSDSLGECVCKDSENMEFNENKTACVVKEEAAKKDAAEALIVRVKEKHQELQKRQAGLKVTVWKDAKGNFNTARLVSDSVAGVVLGTAGGLITSSVVKKNQVENGFEDLKCTVGGQIVADWGDQFRVGIQ